MIKMLYIMIRMLFSFFLLFYSIVSFSQWYWQNPIPTGNSLNDVCILDKTPSSQLIIMVLS